MIRKTVIAVGPTSVGKGYVGKVIAQLMPSPKTHFGVEMGALVRRERDDNPSFNKKYGPDIDRGNLLPDGEARSLVWPVLRQSLGYPTCYNDGYPRTVFQVKDAIKERFINANTIVLDLDASKGTCHKRLIDRKNRNGGMRRGDEDAFERRWQVHLEHHHRVISTFTKHGIRVITLNANVDLPVLAYHILRNVIADHFNVKFDREHFLRCAVPKEVQKPHAAHSATTPISGGDQNSPMMVAGRVTAFRNGEQMTVGA